MKTILVPITLVFCGAVSMLIAIISTNRLRQDVPHDLKNKWHVMSLLMFFFFIGYILFIIGLLIKLPIPIDLITGSVFLGGAFFVLVMVNMAKKTISSLALKEDEIERNRLKIQKALDKISSLMSYVIEQRDEILQFNDPRLKQSPCYEVKQCGKEDCPCYGKEAMRCWQVAGTFCEGKVQGKFAQKFATCTQCEVYRMVTPDPISQIEEQFSNMMHVIKQKSDELQENELRLRSVVETASDAIVSCDSQGMVYSWNQGAEKMFGYPADTIIGKNIISIMPEKYHTAYKRGLEQFLSSDKSKNPGKSIELIGLRKDGTEFPVELCVSRWKVGNESYFTSVIRDITERKHAEQKLHQMAYFDHLTQLPNRETFVKHIKHMLNHKEHHREYQFAVLFIDLDRFKIINDSLGHIIGDKLLVEVARRLEACSRANDKTARFGGDEFAVFLDDIKDVSSAIRASNRIHEVLIKSFEIDGHEIFTSASIGIALSVTGYDNEKDILRDADSAMYRAKATGKAHSEIFDERMHLKVTQLLKLESDLRTAVKKGQLTVYYQPIISTTNFNITGAEALLRWDHPQQGFISPAVFIPIAEETGLISTIGEWVLRTACKQKRIWEDAGYQDLVMKVNFSSRQFKNENLSELVMQIIKDTGIAASHLDIEITESIAMEKSSIRILNQLTAMEVQTSIDDFGTGYSSLGSLAQFHINTIKIDRCFVKDITIDVNSEAIIKAIIAMAHSLNMEVVAEGVETEDQLEFLQLLKCNKIQGYLFSPPLPAEKFIKLLEKEKNGYPTIQKHSIPMG